MNKKKIITSRLSKVNHNLKSPYLPSQLFHRFRNCRDIPCIYVCIYVYPRHDFSIIK